MTPKMKAENLNCNLNIESLNCILKVIEHFNYISEQQYRRK